MRGAIPMREPTTPREAGAARARRALLLLCLLGLGLGLRGGCAWLVRDAPLVNDEYAYQFSALRFLAGDPLETSRPPITALLCAASLELFGGGVAGVRLSLAALGAALVPLLYLLGCEAAGRRAGLAAAALGAVHPTAIGYAHAILSETPFLLLELPALWLLLRQRRPWSRARTPWELAGLGALTGLSALTREVGLALIAASAIGAAWSRRRDPARASLSAGLVLVVAALVIAPWSLHLERTSGEASLVSRTSWMNLYLGNPPPGRALSIPDYLALGPDAATREAEARRRTLEAIAARLPRWPLEKLANLVDLFAPTADPVKRLLAPDGPAAGELGVWRYPLGASRVGGEAPRRLAAALVATSYVALALLGVLGLALLPDRDAALLLAGALAALVAPALLAFAVTRFRLPVEPILIVGAGVVLTQGRQAWRRASPVRRIVAVSALLALAVVLWLGRQAFLSPTAI